MLSKVRFLKLAPIDLKEDTVEFAESWDKIHEAERVLFGMSQNELVELCSSVQYAVRGRYHNDGDPLDDVDCFQVEQNSCGCKMSYPSARELIAAEAFCAYFAISCLCKDFCFYPRPSRQFVGPICEHLISEVDEMELHFYDRETQEDVFRRLDENERRAFKTLMRAMMVRSGCSSRS